MLVKITLLILTIVLGLKTIFPSFLDKLHKLFKDYLKYRKIVKDEQKQKDLEKSKDKLKDAVNNGDLSDLIDAAKDLGRTNKK